MMPDGIIITMNRDEMRTRQERSPALHASDVMAYPIDQHSGGTWIGVNNQGLAMALLNRYDSLPPQEPISRGLIIPEILKVGKARDALEWIMAALPLQALAPFTLLTVSQAIVRRFDWTGGDIQVSDLSHRRTLMITSSSEHYAKVSAYRQAKYEDWKARGCPHTAWIPDLHLQQSEDARSASVLMARDKTHTKSITQIRLHDTHFEMNYVSHEHLDGYAHIAAATEHLCVDYESLKSERIVCHA